MDDLKKTIANNIAFLRKSKKMTQLEFSNELHYSDKAVSKWERAESTPDIVVLKQISDFFGVSVDYLLTEHHKSETSLINTNFKSKRTMQFASFFLSAGIHQHLKRENSLHSHSL